MIELDVTHIVAEDCFKFAASVAERGQNAGPETWANALLFVREKPLVKSEQQDELRAWIREWGAWDDGDIAAMSDDDTNALLLQFVAGDVREMENFSDYAEYLAAAEAGQVQGNLYRSDDGTQWFYTLS